MIDLQAIPHVQSCRRIKVLGISEWNFPLCSATELLWNPSTVKGSEKWVVFGLGSKAIQPIQNFVFGSIGTCWICWPIRWLAECERRAAVVVIVIVEKFILRFYIDSNTVYVQLKTMQSFHDAANAGGKMGLGSRKSKSKPPSISAQFNVSVTFILFFNRPNEKIEIRGPLQQCIGHLQNSTVELVLWEVWKIGSVMLCILTSLKWSMWHYLCGTHVSIEMICISSDIASMENFGLFIILGLEFPKAPALASQVDLTEYRFLVWYVVLTV